ncbi:hypothetical protein ACLMJK_003534 [Lecanora helva]
MASKEEQADRSRVEPKTLSEMKPKSVGFPNNIASSDAGAPQAMQTPSKEVQASVEVDDPKVSQEEKSTTDATTHPEDVDLNDDDGGDEGGQAGMGMAKKKRKSKRPKSKRGLNAPSGFEEYYVDTPVTPAEFEEEKKIYDSSYKFTQRIETAIQRYVAKRRMDNETKKLFDKYLIHGGIEGGPKMFGGLDPQAVKTMTAVEIAELAATHYVDSDKVDTFEANHVVDFEGCLKSFLSGELPDMWELKSEEQIKKLIGIIRNFLNYLLHHDVCPEYKDQINAARSLCDKAVKELWNVTLMSSLLLGDFNMACSEIFGGTYQGMHTANRSWMENSDLETSIGISPERARHAFKIGMAANANDEVFHKYRQQLSAKECKLISTEGTNFEISEIIPPSQTALGLYAQQQAAGLNTLGKIRANTWFNPREADEDLTEDEEAHLKEHPPETKAYEFWLEEDILRKCEVGMKFTATVRQTSFGLMYFDTVSSVLCSFYQAIPNELMDDWREIEKEWLPMRQTNVAKDDEGQDDDVVANGEQRAAQSDVKTRTDKNEFSNSVGPISREHAPQNELEEATANINLGSASNASMQTAETNFGVEVHKAGEELTEVAGNSDTVLQKTFDVKRIEEIE